MGKVIFIIIITAAISCNNSSNLDIKSYFYPDNDSFDTNKLITIDLNSVIDYVDLLFRIDSLTCASKNINILLDSGNSVYNLQPFSICLIDNRPPLPFKLRNILSIKDDSIIRPFKKHDLSEISDLLHKFYNKSDVNSPPNHKKGILIISFKDITGIGKIKSTLKDIYDNYNRINFSEKDSLQLNIMFAENSEVLYLPSDF